MPGIRRQSMIRLFSCVCGAATYVNVSQSVSHDSTLGIIWWGALLALGWFTVLAYMFEKDPITGKVRKLFNWRTQSWTFMFGGPLIVAILVVTGHAWGDRPETIGAYAHQWWWLWLVAAVAFISFGAVFRYFDHQNYVDAELVLGSPTKWWIDYIQMSAFFGLLVTRVWPILRLHTWDGQSIAVVVGLAVLLGLMAADMRRMLKPFNQHVKWDSGAGQVIV